MSLSQLATSCTKSASLRRHSSATLGRKLIRLENITKTYRLGEIDVPVLKGISDYPPRRNGRDHGGLSGSGKTTLMNILGCLDRPSSGQFWLDGQEMSDMTPNQRAMVRTVKLGFVFQNFNLLPRTTGRAKRGDAIGLRGTEGTSHDRRQLCRTILQRVGLGERCEHEPSQMSGGQQQRVAIAGRWLIVPRLCWRTSRPAISIRAPASRFWRCSRISIPRESPWS